MNLSDSFSSWAELVWRYRLEVTNTVTDFEPLIGHGIISLLTLTLTAILVKQFQFPNPTPHRRASTDLFAAKHQVANNCNIGLFEYSGWTQFYVGET